MTETLQVPARILNELFNESLEEKIDKCQQLVKIFLSMRLEALAPDARLLGSDISKLADRITLFYSLRLKGREGTYKWTSTEQELLKDDRPLTEILNEHLGQSLEMLANGIDGSR